MLLSGPASTNKFSTAYGPDCAVNACGQSVKHEHSNVTKSPSWMELVCQKEPVVVAAKTPFTYHSKSVVSVQLLTLAKNVTASFGHKFVLGPVMLIPAGIRSIPVPLAITSKEASAGKVAPPFNAPFTTT